MRNQKSNYKINIKKSKVALANNNIRSEVK